MGIKMTSQKIYKSMKLLNISNRQIVSMIPGDLKVAGCFNFSCNIGGLFL